MRKIPTLFIRNAADPLRVVSEVNAQCQWVAKGEGVATRKWDGRPLLFNDGLWYKRYTGDLRGYHGSAIGAIHCGEEDDTTTIWWVLITYTREDQHIRAAIETARLWSRNNNGTYEICGPNFCHNRERLSSDCLIKHGSNGIFADAPVVFDDLRTWIFNMDVEGVVWHHPDGRMAKIKKSDFGFRRDPSPLARPLWPSTGLLADRSLVVDRDSKGELRGVIAASSMAQTEMQESAGELPTHDIGGEG